MDNPSVNTAPAPFNIADFEAADTGILEVQNKKGDGPLLLNGKPLRLELFGPGSREYLSAQHKQELYNQTASYAAARGKPLKETVEDRIERGTVRLVSLTRSVENFPLSAREIYSNPKLGYVTAQAANYIEDWANF